MAKERKNSKAKTGESSIVIAIAEGTLPGSENKEEMIEQHHEKKPKLKKLTNWKNEPTFQQLKYDYDMAQPDHQEYLLDLCRWRENLAGGKELDLPANRSKSRPKIIRKFSEWKCPALEEPFLSTDKMFSVKPRAHDDPLRAEQSELYINYQWNTKVKRNILITETIRTLVNEGTAIIKSGWEIEEKEIKVFEEETVYADQNQMLMVLSQRVQAGDITEEQAQQFILSGNKMPIGTKKIEVPRMILTRNQPKYELCDNESVILDPTAKGNPDDLRFVIHEYETDMSELKKEEFSEDTYIDEETGERITNIIGKYKNLDYISESDKIDNTSQNGNVYNQKTQFNFDSKDTRRKFKAYDYWGYWDIHGNGILEPIVATWVGSTLIRLQLNPFPHKKIPFSFGAYIPEVGKIRGLPDGELLEDNQEQIGRMTRAINDMIATQAVGQTFIDEQFFSSRVEKDNYNEGRTVYYKHGMDPKKSIYRTQVEAIDSTTLQMINMYTADAESLSGTKSFGSGIGGNAYGTVAAGIRNTMDAVSKREISSLRRIGENLFTDIGKKTIAMNQAYIEEEEMIRVTGNEFITIKREDITGEFDLVCDVSTAEKDNETAQDLAMLAQTNAAVMPQEVTKMIWAKILKLKKQPDLAQQILDYTPEPDPVQQQLAMLQLENAKLENEKLKKEIEEMDSRIHERVSRVLENEQDVGTKIAKQKLDEAKADKLRSETDMLDAAFLEKTTGNDRARELENKAIDVNAKYEIEKLKMQNSNQRSADAISSASTEKIENENIQTTDEEIL